MNAAEQCNVLNSSFALWRTIYIFESYTETSSNLENTLIPKTKRRRGENRGGGGGGTNREVRWRKLGRNCAESRGRECPWLCCGWCCQIRLNERDLGRKAVLCGEDTRTLSAINTIIHWVEFKFIREREIEREGIDNYGCDGTEVWGDDVDGVDDAELSRRRRHDVEFGDGCGLIVKVPKLCDWLPVELRV